MFPSTDTVQPRRNVFHVCPRQRALRSVRSVLLRLVPQSHTPRLARQKSEEAKALLLSPGMHSGPAVSEQSPLLRVLVLSMPSPIRRSPSPKNTEILARGRARAVPPPALAPRVSPRGIDEAQQ